MSRRPTGGIAAAFAIALVIPGLLGAQTQSRSWTLCSVNDPFTCNSLQIITTAQMSLGERIGTYLTINFQNLQGVAPLDDSGARTLWGFSFDSPYIGGPSGLALPLVTTVGTPSGDVAGGGPTDGGEAFRAETFSNGTVTSVYDQFDRTNFMGVQGCDADPTWTSVAIGRWAGSPFFTCGTDAWISFSFTTAEWIDAESVTDATLRGTGVVNSYASPWVCSTSSPDCKIVASTATPEPATIALFATGLFGIGAVRRRIANGGRRSAGGGKGERRTS